MSITSPAAELIQGLHKHQSNPSFYNCTEPVIKSALVEHGIPIHVGKDPEHHFPVSMV